MLPILTAVAEASYTHLGRNTFSTLGISLCLIFWHDFLPTSRKPTSSRHRSFSFRVGLHGLCRRPRAAGGGLSLPSTESFSLLGLQRQRSACPCSTGRWTGSRAGRGFLHRAVLSVSLSISSRMRPGRSLLAESGGTSGKRLRSGSETLELVSGQKHEETRHH